VKDRVVAAIKRGEVVILPLEHSYVYACDAFSFASVNRLHQLRNDPTGVAAQVLVASAQIIDGLAQGVSSDMKALANTFWPGLLTLMLQPNQSLNWDLGDRGNLETFALRSPNQAETLEVISQTGPLAIATAGLAGTSAVSTISNIHDLEALDIGEIPAGPFSTVVALEGGNLIVNRVGALTIAELRKVASAIQLPTE
jgi:tRNA threonylcarbamoyl adenosine modification protein (Sua5/YciO/YrdC/YwlC family)